MSLEWHDARGFVGDRNIWIVLFTGSARRNQSAQTRKRKINDRKREKTKLCK